MAFRQMEPAERKLDWPAWATWSVIVIAATSLLTIAATINELVNG